MNVEEISKVDIVYEDDIGFAVLGKSVLGHIRVYPKKEVKKLEELNDNDIDHLFIIASYAATVVFETLGAQGTNIVAHSHTMSDDFYIDIIPRSVNDDLNLMWEPKPLSEPELEDAFERIKDKCDYVDLEKTNKKDSPIKSEIEEEEDDSDEEDDNVMVKHLDRSP